MKHSIKGIVHPKMKSHYLLTLLPMEGPVKFFGPQNTAGVSQEKGISVISQIIIVNGDYD